MPSGSNVDLGDHLIISGLSAGTLNATLVPPTDVSAWKWISLYIGNDVYSGLLTAQYSYDLVNWQDLPMYNMTSLDAGDTNFSFAASNVELGAPVSAPYFQVVMTSYTSGTATATLQLHSTGLSGLQLLTTNVRILSALNKIGYINNDGTQPLAIAAGKASDTLVSSSGGMIGSILVTTAGTHEMVIYDNNAAASGTEVAIVPTTKVRGDIIPCHAPCSTGIYVAGNSNNPGITIFF